MDMQQVLRVLYNITKQPGPSHWLIAGNISVNRVSLLQDCQNNPDMHTATSIIPDKHHILISSTLHDVFLLFAHIKENTENALHTLSHNLITLVEWAWCGASICWSPKGM